MPSAFDARHRAINGISSISVLAASKNSSYSYYSFAIIVIFSK
ncbi:MAG: hypothetical protein ACTSXD_12370 [Candidatus Heimdallarchaeaceae archaeon]